MNIASAIWLNLMMGLLLANLPFSTLFRPARWRSASLDFLCWLACYACWMALGAGLEAATAKATPKDWELWAVTVALFGVLSFPGIVWKYLLKK
ncbi:DUF2818 family protein [Rugamonas sp.]|uniref:DUF2818 family protein n=1 Tax=Rugamonas sp. TaxID=1926287 RepID=UPI0025D7838D|nr:DUF2818 family protein [Rugamonas sp.]